ncbi:hypothetical protein [Streptomyces diastaticus]|uniref:hypothetical protein n=1 Tax=Streptomyces diastaticus TaxID=1956 RepID=UPI0013BB3E4C|nr:hypothetical protein [Streptomyces sp. SID8455]
MADPNFSGIDPDKLSRTITSLASGGKILQQGKNAYTVRFRKLGLDTTHLTELGRIAAWVDDELPMLRRRQTLAAAMEFEGVGPKSPVVMVREPVWTAKRAHAEGGKLAEKAAGIADMDAEEAGPAFHRIAVELAARAKDPDFSAAFYAAMDPEVVKQLPLAVAAAGAATAQDDLKVFGTAFTSATTAEKPPPGFHKVLEVFHGDLPEDEPGALFNRVLMQNDDPELWDKAWHHLKTAITDLGDPDKTWTVHAGLVAGVIGVQSQLADHLWESSRVLAGDAKAAYEKRINALTPGDRAEFRRETRAHAKASKSASRQAERLFAKYGMGSFSRLMETSLGDSARWFADKVPYVKAPPAVKAGWLGKAFRVGGRLPLVGTVLTIGGIAYDIEVHDADADVAVVSNAASLGVGMGTTWGATAMVAAAGGPVGWAVAAGVVVGVGVGYGAYYVLSGTETGRKAVRAVTDTAKSVGEGIGAAARKVGGWLGV